ncbi:MAG: HAD family hydrolase [Akkermansia sp.]
MAHKALFLDRDGVINIDTHYAHRIDDFVLVPGILELCRQAQDKGYLLIVVTNQSGIERGLFSEEDYQLFTQHMRNVFAKQQISIKDVFHCPSLNHEDRKPRVGMFLKAQVKYDIDMASSLNVGDKERDITAGINAGVGRNYLYSHDRLPSHATAIVSSLTEIIPSL